MTTSNIQELFNAWQALPNTKKGPFMDRLPVWQCADLVDYISRVLPQRSQESPERLARFVQGLGYSEKEAKALLEEIEAHYKYLPVRQAIRDYIDRKELSNG
jgi:hypothetical protein